MRFHAWCLGLLLAAAGAAAPLDCDLSQYKEQPGLRAEVSGETLRLTWQGERQQELRAAFGIDSGQPLVRELAVRRGGGSWAVLASGVSAGETVVVDGQLRLSPGAKATVKAPRGPAEQAETAEAARR